VSSYIFLFFIISVTILIGYLFSYFTTISIGTGSNSLQSQIKKDFSENTFLKASIFAITLTIAMLSVYGVAVIPLFFLIPLFPAGLIAVITQNFTNTPKWSIIMGWLIYMSFFLIAAFTKKRRLLIFIYVIFVILLIANVAGCKLLELNTTKGLN
jgi:hypothetical protein